MPDIASPYRASSKIEHRPSFSPPSTSSSKGDRRLRQSAFHEHSRWNAEQVHDYVPFMANTGLRPDEASNLGEEYASHVLRLDASIAATRH